MGGIVNFADIADDVMFFGRWNQPGHYLYAPNGRQPMTAIVVPWLQRQLDALMVDPNVAQPQFALQRTDGPVVDELLWLRLGFWDRTGDTRLNSHSAMLFLCHHEFLKQPLDLRRPPAGLMRRFSRAFPELWRRWAAAGAHFTLP